MSTTTDSRDRIAEMLGFEYNRGHPRDSIIGALPRWIHPDGTETLGEIHVIPASLDFVSRAWPDHYMFADIAFRENHEQRRDRAMGRYVQLLRWFQDDNPTAFAAAKAKALKVLEEMR